MTAAERNEIINKTLKHEGGFGIDTNGGWVYMGVNSNSNPTWPGWDKITKLINKTKFEHFSPSKEGVYNKIWNDPLLTKDVTDLATGGYYWSGNNFEEYNDKRVVSNLFEQRYAGGMEDVMKCAFGTTNRRDAANKANSMSGDEALNKVIECREKYYNSCNYRQQTPDGDPPFCHESGKGPCNKRVNSSGKTYTETGWNYLRKSALDRMRKHNADWMGTGSSTSYPNTGNNDENFLENKNEVTYHSDPREGNWFIEHKGIYYAANESFLNKK